MVKISRMNIVAVTLTLYLSVASATPIIRADNIDTALRDRGNPPSLMFLTALTLAPKLSAAIAQDIEMLPPEEARKRITNRLRLELVGTGVLTYPVASEASHDVASGSSATAAGSAPNSSPSQLTTESSTLNKNEKSLSTFGAIRNSARQRNFEGSPPELNDAFPDKQVLATAYSVFNKKLEQTTPGIAVDPQPEATSLTSPPTNTGIGAQDATVRVAPTQTIPGTPTSILKNCKTPFDKLAGPNCIKNGQRCESFSRWQFGEVVEITTPSGGTCSGTLINAFWILSAAHCFIPGQSAKTFSSKSNDRHDNAGNTVLQLGDLQHTVVYARYADPKATDTIKRVERVVVDPNWDPGKVIQDGRVILVSGQTVRADWVYPDDLALIKLVDTDAVKSVEPATLPSEDYVGVITTAGYGVTTVGDGHSGDLWVTWPTPPVRSSNTELELDEVGTTNISTFCEGDSGGPAFEGRNRGCPADDGEPRPRTLIGVTSHYYGQLPTSNDTAIEDADFCMSAPVSRFMNMATPAYHQWVCKVTTNTALGCS